MTRREAVALVGLSGVALLTRRAAAQGTGRAPACVVRPQQAEGPFFIDEKLNRSDIRGEPGRGDAKAGAVLQLAFAVSRLSGGACAPLGGAQVDVWHCDALGAYSDGAQKFLRGYQVTDGTGRGALRHDLSRRVRRPRGAHPLQDPRAGAGIHLADLLRRGRHRPRVRVRAVRRGAVARLRNDGDGLFRSGGRQLLVTPQPSGAGYATTFEHRAQHVDGQQLGSALPRHDVGRVPRRAPSARWWTAARRGWRSPRPTSSPISTAACRARARSSPSARRPTPSRSSPASSTA